MPLPLKITKLIKNLAMEQSANSRRSSVGVVSATSQSPYGGVFQTQIWADKDGSSNIVSMEDMFGGSAGAGGDATSVVSRGNAGSAGAGGTAGSSGAGGAFGSSGAGGAFGDGGDATSVVSRGWPRFGIISVQNCRRMSACFKVRSTVRVLKRH